MKINADTVQPEIEVGDWFQHHRITWNNHITSNFNPSTFKKKQFLPIPPIFKATRLVRFGYTDTCEKHVVRIQHLRTLSPSDLSMLMIFPSPIHILRS